MVLQVTQTLHFATNKQQKAKSFRLGFFCAKKHHVSAKNGKNNSVFPCKLRVLIKIFAMFCQQYKPLAKRIPPLNKSLTLNLSKVFYTCFLLQQTQLSHAVAKTYSQTNCKVVFLLGTLQLKMGRGAHFDGQNPARFCQQSVPRNQAN